MGIQADQSRQVTRAWMLDRVRETVQAHSLTRVSGELRRMQSTLEDVAANQVTVAGNQELILSLAQARVLEMREAFLPTTLEGDQSPDVGEEAHISDEVDGSGEPYFQDDYEL